MTHRERFNKLFSGETVDRVPFIDFMGHCNFPSCLKRWKSEGLDPNAGPEDVRRLIGFDYVRGYFLNVKLFVYPEFETSIVSRDGDKILRSNKWGGVELQQEGSELMPLTVEGPVKDRYSWEKIKERLTGDISIRFPEGFENICKEAAESGLPVYTGDLPAGYFGALRELLGLEGLFFMLYDDPGLLSEILDTFCELWINMYSEIQKHVPLDYIFIWEDMCDKRGPLISPKHFEEFLLPRYKQLIKTVRQNGCQHIMVDSDGNVLPLVPLWMDGDVNIVVPWETQFGLDMADVRKEYPKLGIIGGLNKHVLEFSRSEMDKELDKVPYMLEQGYFIPSLDHGTTNAVSWDNYQYFYDRLRGMIIK